MNEPWTPEARVMLAVIQAIGYNCTNLFQYVRKDGGWQVLLCNDDMTEYRLNQALDPEVIQRLDGQTGHLDTWKFIGRQWIKQ